MILTPPPTGGQQILRHALGLWLACFLVLALPS